MYTLRIFQEADKISRTQISLGESYTVEGVSQEDEKMNMKYRVLGQSNNLPDDGICVFNDDYAFIMTESGKTFETLNRPKTMKA